MQLYQKLYWRLFNAVTDALALLARGESGGAAALLKAAQCECEELYMDGGAEAFPQS